MKKINLFLIVLTICISLVGCDTASSELHSSSAEDTEAKQGETTLSGKLVGIGNKAVLQLDNGDTTSLESYSLEFDDFDGSNVVVTGEYSGTTLYVDEISTYE